MIESILDLPLDAQPNPEEFLRVAMEWHFRPETGSPYWLEPGIPHDAYLGEFLMRTKALIRD